MTVCTKTVLALDEMAGVMTSGGKNTIRNAGRGAGILSNSVFILWARGVQIASSFFILIAIVRYLSVEKYGEYSYVATFALTAGSEPSSEPAGLSPPGKSEQRQAPMDRGNQR